MDKRSDALDYCSKCLFTASERLRECLDTLELELQNEPLNMAQIYELSICQNSLERIAKVLQGKIKR